MHHPNHAGNHDIRKFFVIMPTLSYGCLSIGRLSRSISAEENVRLFLRMDEQSQILTDIYFREKNSFDLKNISKFIQPKMNRILLILTNMIVY